MSAANNSGELLRVYKAIVQYEREAAEWAAMTPEQKANRLMDAITRQFGIYNAALGDLFQAVEELRLQSSLPCPEPSAEEE